MPSEEAAAVAMPHPLKNRSIIVLGMHRSGTSVFTGVLGLLGVDLGPKLMPAASTNESGHWEHAEVVQVHDRLLMALQSRWDDVSRLPTGWSTSELVAPYREKLREIICRDFAGSPLWAIKDPRLCRLLPLWTALLEELECQPLWVLLSRNPPENIGSLEKRDLFSREKSELLWLQHTLDAERDTRGHNRVMVNFDQLLDDWHATLLRIQHELGMPWPVAPKHAAAQIRQFIDPGKRHHRVENTAGLSWWTRDTYEALLAGAAGDEAKMLALLAPVHRAFDAAEALYTPVIHNRGSELEMQMAEVSATYANQLDSFRELQERYRETKEKLTAKSAEVKAQREQLRQFERSPGGRLARLVNRFQPGAGKSSGREAPAEAAAFPVAVEPVDVSIIVSAAGDQAKTERCLLSVREHAGECNFEVLAVTGNDGAAGLQHWENLQVCPVGDARRFGEAHNRAAQRARGRFIVFLQNDMTASPGWLEALLAPLRSDLSTGIVGTEGGALSSDGTFQILDETEPEQLREVDFCTAACFAITKNLFFQVGGFDGYYLPVEEANIGLKIRQTRHKVLQQPLCRPTRQSPRLPMDPKRLDSNRRRFLRRWAETLAKPHASGT